MPRRAGKQDYQPLRPRSSRRPNGYGPGEKSVVVIAAALDDNLHSKNSCDQIIMNRTDERGKGDGMFLVVQADLVAIRRAFMAGGRDGAMAKLQRRYLAQIDNTTPTQRPRTAIAPYNGNVSNQCHHHARPAPAMLGHCVGESPAVCVAPIVQCPCRRSLPR